MRTPEQPDASEVERIAAASFGICIRRVHRLCDRSGDRGCGDAPEKTATIDTPCLPSPIAVSSALFSLTQRGSQTQQRWSRHLRGLGCKGPTPAIKDLAQPRRWVERPGSRRLLGCGMHAAGEASRASTLHIWLAILHPAKRSSSARFFLDFPPSSASGQAAPHVPLGPRPQRWKWWQPSNASSTRLRRRTSPAFARKCCPTAQRLSVATGNS